MDETKKYLSGDDVANYHESARPHELPILHFKKVSDYTTFTAEYAFDGNDIVFHFFLPPEREGSGAGTKTYWLQVFPATLEPVVRASFRAGPPQLQAAYIDELGIDSWWLRAYGFARLLDPDLVCQSFLADLDAALEATKKM